MQHQKKREAGDQTSLPSWAEPRNSLNKDSQYNEQTAVRPKRPEPPDPPSRVPLSGTWIVVVFGLVYAVHKLWR